MLKELQKGELEEVGEAGDDTPGLIEKSKDAVHIF